MTKVGIRSPNLQQSLDIYTALSTNTKLFHFKGWHFRSLLRWFQFCQFFRFAFNSCFGCRLHRDKRLSHCYWILSYSKQQLGIPLEASRSWSGKLVVLSWLLQLGTTVLKKSTFCRDLPYGCKRWLPTSSRARIWSPMWLHRHQMMEMTFSHCRSATQGWRNDRLTSRSCKLFFALKIIRIC